MTARKLTAAGMGRPAKYGQQTVWKSVRLPDRIVRVLRRRAMELGVTVPDALQLIVRDLEEGGDPVLRAQLYLKEKDELERNLVGQLRRAVDRMTEDQRKLVVQGMDLKEARVKLARALKWLSSDQIRQLNVNLVDLKEQASNPSPANPVLSHTLQGNIA